MRSTYADPETGASITTSRSRIGRDVDKVYCPPKARGKGVATRLFRQMLAQADREGVTLRLVISADGDGGPDDEQLERWYLSLGFVKTSTFYYMRKPKNDNRETLHASAA